MDGDVFDRASAHVECMKIVNADPIHALSLLTRTEATGEVERLRAAIVSAAPAIPDRKSFEGKEGHKEWLRQGWHRAGWQKALDAFDRATLPGRD